MRTILVQQGRVGVFARRVMLVVETVEVDASYALLAARVLHHLVAGDFGV